MNSGDINAAGEENLWALATKGEILRFNDIGKITTFAINLGFNPEFHKDLESFFLSEHLNMIDLGKRGYSLEPV